MRLINLDPRWFVIGAGNVPVGVTFLCPHCRQQRLAIAFHHDGKAAMEDQFILANHGASDSQHIWTLLGQDNFETLTLTPSVDASKFGHWHGFITNGQIVGGI